MSKKEQARGALNAAYDNVNEGIEELKWQDDQGEISVTLLKLTGLDIGEDFEARRPEVLARMEPKPRPKLTLVK